ncbi:MAG: hypothetical protein ABUT20_17490 [Bacteroidota bacterium]
MEQFKNLSLPELIDKLSEYTIKYSQIRTEGGLKEEFNNCRFAIEHLTQEIESRKNATQYSNEILNDSQRIFFTD